MDRASVWLHGIEKVYHKDDFDVRVSANEFSLENIIENQFLMKTLNILLVEKEKIIKIQK